ncbi:MAG: PKD domain-containing protein [Holophagaceae bacterium]|nr:PKD domain-containing protein [Holophagaceae bacterium]
MLPCRWVPGSTFAVLACLMAAGCGGDNYNKDRVAVKPPSILNDSLKWQRASATDKTKWEQGEVQVGLDYRYTVGAVPDIGGTIVRYEWRFGDDALESTAVPYVDYKFSTSVGAFVTVNVKVTDGYGAKAERDFVVPLSQDVMPLRLTPTKPDEKLEINIDESEIRDIPFEFTLETISGSPDPVIIEDIEFEVDDHMVGGRYSQIIETRPGTYSFTVTYGKSGLIDYTDTPTIEVTDTQGRRSGIVEWPSITIHITSAPNTAPKITVVNVAPDIGEGKGSGSARLNFTIQDAENDYVDWAVEWGDGNKTVGAATGTRVGRSVSIGHEYSNPAGTEMPITITVNDRRRNSQDVFANAMFVIEQ